MTHSRLGKQFVQMSGEFGVTSELYRRGIQASLTYGNSKSADVVVFSEAGSRAARVEVKSASIRSWIVGKQALLAAPHIVWVFVFMPSPADTLSPAQVAENGLASPRYFILDSLGVKQLYERKLEEAKKKKAKKLSDAEMIEIESAQGEYLNPNKKTDTKTKPKRSPKDPMIVFFYSDLQNEYNRWDRVETALKK
ncbi:hypothetical protein [Pseudomonas sp. PWP3-1b2]|uniref:hypothetical protein n=1 Tax=Pseudomonas sp. PWP3-1b2 TaxID=2804656 RepID=UPI003CF27010